MLTVQEAIAQLPGRKEVFELLGDLAKERVVADPELGMLLSKQEPYSKGVVPADVLARHSLPAPGSEYRTLLREGSADIEPAMVKDGHVYAFRGDFPGLEDKGIYSLGYTRWNANLDQMLQLLDGEELLSHYNFQVRNKLEEMMWIQSNGGGENFLSATSKFRVAQKHPKYKENSGVVYVLKIPVERAFRNYASVCLDNEHEVLIPDYVVPEEIIEVLDPTEFYDPDVTWFMK